MTPISRFLQWSRLLPQHDFNAGPLSFQDLFKGLLIFNKLYVLVSFHLRAERLDVLKSYLCSYFLSKNNCLVFHLHLDIICHKVMSKKCM